MPFEEILPGLWRVGGGTWNGTVPALSAEGDANAYLLRSNGATALIDCGTLDGRAQIEANIEEAHAGASELRHLLLSHSHWDHTQAASEWQSSYDVRTHLNATGASFLNRGDHRLVGYQMHGPDYPFCPFSVQHPIEDGETFDLLDVEVTAHFLPGHTPDSTLFTFRHEEVLVGICGDVAFGPNARAEPALGFLSSLWLSDLDAYVESLAKLAQMPLDVLVPGHGTVIGGRERVADAVTSALRTAESLAQDPAVRTNLGI